MISFWGMYFDICVYHMVPNVFQALICWPEFMAADVPILYQGISIHNTDLLLR